MFVQQIHRIKLLPRVSLSYEIFTYDTVLSYGVLRRGLLFCEYIFRLQKRVINEMTRVCRRKSRSTQLAVTLAVAHTGQFAFSYCAYIILIKLYFLNIQYLNYFKKDLTQIYPFIEYCFNGSVVHCLHSKACCAVENAFSYQNLTR